MRIQSVAYNDPASTFVVVLQPSRLINSADQRVFLRSRVASGYREIALPGALLSITDTLVSPTVPTAFVNVKKWTGAERRGANYLGLFRISLPEGTLERLPEPTDPCTAPEWIHVTALLGASPDGSLLHVIVTRTTFVRLPPGGHTMGFFLAAYSTESGEIRIIDEVPGVFA